MHGTAETASDWVVEHHVGSAGELHQLDVAPRRTVMTLEVARPALVLGSAQSDSIVDRRALTAAGIDLARRRSGGGAVLLVPGEHVWVDVVLPIGDPLWVDDVESSSWWLGEAWSLAIGAAMPVVGPVGGPVAVHRRGVTDRELGRLVCFAATGPGEVSVAGRKVVGISQRRTRELARFQCVVHRRFDPGSTTSVLAPPGAGPTAADLGAALRDGVCDLESLGIDHRWSVVEGLLANLP